MTARLAFLVFVALTGILVCNKAARCAETLYIIAVDAPPLRFTEQLAQWNAYRFSGYASVPRDVNSLSREEQKAAISFAFEQMLARAGDWQPAQMIAETTQRILEERARTAFQVRVDSTIHSGPDFNEIYWGGWQSQTAMVAGTEGHKNWLKDKWKPDYSRVPGDTNAILEIAIVNHYLMPREWAWSVDHTDLTLQVRIAMRIVNPRSKEVAAESAVGKKFPKRHYNAFEEDGIAFKALYQAALDDLATESLKELKLIK